MSRLLSRSADAQRGQALTETALVLPMFLLVLFGIEWSIQTSVIAERAQLAVRFSGLVSDQASQYTNYSVFSFYNASSAPALSCTNPTDNVLYQGGSLATGPQYTNGTVTPPFFYPAQSSTTNCTPGVAVLSGGSLVTPLVFIHTLSQITSYTQAQSILQGTLPGFTGVLAQQNYLETPDVPHLLTCYPELQAALPQSLNHTYLGATTAATPIPQSAFTTPLTVNASC
jgi:Flp pilus assembly protein TadG